MANKGTALDALGIKKDQVIAPVEVKELQEHLPAGIYQGKIIEFGIYTSASGALMAFAELELNVDGSERTLKDYMFIPKDQTDEDIKKDLKKAKNMIKMKDRVLSKINEYVEAVGMSLESIETETVKNDVSDEFNRFVGVASETEVSVFVKVEHTEGSQYEWKNIVEAVFDKDGCNSAGEDQKPVFLENIEKRPIIEKKAVVATSTGSVTNSNKKSAAAML